MAGFAAPTEPDANNAGGQRALDERICAVAIRANFERLETTSVQLGMAVCCSRARLLRTRARGGDRTAAPSQRAKHAVPLLVAALPALVAGCALVPGVMAGPIRGARFPNDLQSLSVPW